VKEAAIGVEAVAEAAPGPATEARQIYNPHIELADGMKQRLRDCAELAYKMGDIPKPDLVDLMPVYQLGHGRPEEKVARPGRL